MKARLAALVLLALAGASTAQDRPGGLAPPAREGPAVLLTAPRPVSQFDARKTAGIPRGVEPVVLTWDFAYRLALARSEGSDPRAALARRDPLTADEFDRLRAAMARPRAEGGSPRPFADPTSETFEALRRLQAVESSYRLRAAHEALQELHREYARGGGTSSASRAELERLADWARDVLRESEERTAAYRDALDDLKARLGLPLTDPVVVDPAALGGFARVFDNLDLWAARQDNDYGELPTILRRLPAPPDLTTGGRSLLAAIRTDADGGSALMASATRSLNDDPSALAARKRLRRLALLGGAYEAEREHLEFQTREGDRALQRLLAPPPASNPGDALPKTDQPETTRTVLRSLEARLDSRDKLVALWTEAQILRHSLRRDLDLLPRGRDEWMRDFSSGEVPAPAKGQPPGR